MAAVATDDTAVQSLSPSGRVKAAGKVIDVVTKFTLPVYGKGGAEVGTVDIDPALFGGKINKQLLHDVVLMYLANQRAGTHSTLRRGEVAGSTKKLFRQKGTGNARAGTKRTNKRRGGGTAKGPKPRDYEYHLPKKAVKAATRMAILSKFVDGEAVILDDAAVTMTTPKTKEMRQLLEGVKAGTKMVKKGDERVEKQLTLADVKVLLGTATYDLNVYKSGRNLEGVKVLPATEFNAYAVLKCKRLVLTRSALDVLLHGPKVAPADVAVAAAG